MRIRHSLASHLAWILVYGPLASAADVDGNYAVWGVGQASCHQFTQAYAQQATQDYKNYLEGYLTAFNTLADGVYQATGKNTTTDNLTVLQAHCSANPLHSYERAVQSLLAQTRTTLLNTPKGKTVTWGQPPAEQRAP